MPTPHDDDMVDEYDFSQAKRGPVLAQPGKTRVTLWVDTDVYEAYIAYATHRCREVAPEMNIALRQYIETLWGEGMTTGGEAPTDTP